MRAAQLWPSNRRSGAHALITSIFLAALLCVSAVLPAWAVVINWDGGGGDYNWYTANNWAPDGVPTLADFVTIDAIASVAVNVSSPPINFNTLILGAAGGTNTVTLILSTTIASGGSLTIHKNASLVQNSSQTLKLNGSLTVEKGGIITHSDNATVRDYAVNLEVAGAFDLQDGSTITVDGLGYDGSVTSGDGFGPGGGKDGSGTGSGGGGGHGGSGGAGSAPGGIVNDPQNADLGSGGGTGYPPTSGGSGGGAVILKAVTLTLNGRITANGMVGATNTTYGGGGGAGGSVYITATNISGSGVIVASGAAGGGADKGGGGGGGRILVLVTGTGDPCAINTDAAGGTGNKSGDAGIVTVVNSAGMERTWLGIVDGANWHNAGNWSPPGIPLSTHDVLIGPGASVMVSSFSPAINFQSLQIGSSAGCQKALLTLSTGIASGGSITMYNNASLVQRSTETLKLSGNLTVENGGLITSSNNATARNYVVNFDVGGTLDLKDGSIITVDGLGYDGSSSGIGWGPGGGGTGVGKGSGGGGGHGGPGGAGGGGSATGVANDFPAADLGSGGGVGHEITNESGGSGGGAVILKAGVLNLLGRITANGQAGLAGLNYGGGGGAGGSINITAASLSGNGVIVATGAAGGIGGAINSGGGGGGGRIFINVTATGDPCTLNTNASGGAGSQNGAAGAVSLVNSAGIGKMWLGDGGDSTWNNSGNWFPPGIPSSAHNVLIGPGANVTVSAASPAINFQSLQIGSSIGCQTAASSLALSTGISSGGSLTIHNRATLVQASTETLTLNGNITVEQGGIITSSDNSTARNYVVNLDVAGAFDLQAGSTITVAGLGYDGSTTGQGAGLVGGLGTSGPFSGGGGGGHGGAGGAASLFNGGASNDLSTTDLGSGGGAGGGALGGSGGGAVILKAGTLTLNGYITAAGQAGASNGTYGAGGGAGGSVNIVVANFLGNGVIVSSGGAAGAGSIASNGGGGGGGGRIFVMVMDMGDPNTLNTDVSAGIKGISGYSAGSVGFLSLLQNVSGFAGAPPTHSFAGCGFPDTGQKTCYEIGGAVKYPCPAVDDPLSQDGTYSPSATQLSYTIYNPVDTSSVTVDNRTGLMWITDPVAVAGMGGTYIWESAITACEGLNYANYPDWHLPNLRELLSIVNYQIMNPAIDDKAFPGTKNDYYWTSTTYMPGTSSAWLVDFSTGQVGTSTKSGSPFYVRCVRGGP